MQFNPALIKEDSIQLSASTRIPDHNGDCIFSTSEAGSVTIGVDLPPTTTGAAEDFTEYYWSVDYKENDGLGDFQRGSKGIYARGKQRFEYSIIVPKSTFYGSKLYTAAASAHPDEDGNGLSDLGYTDDNAGEFMTRGSDSSAFDSSYAPRELEGVIKLKDVNIDTLLDHLRMNSNDEVFAKLYDLKYYDWHDDANAHCDITHKIGLPASILALIPNAPKSIESPYVDYPDNDKSWLSSLRDICTKVIDYGKNALDFIVDIGETLVDLGMGFVNGVIEAAEAVAEAVVNAFNAFKEWVKDQIISRFSAIFIGLMKSIQPQVPDNFEDLVASIDATDGATEDEVSTVFNNYLSENSLEGDINIPKSLQTVMKWAGRFVSSGLISTDLFAQLILDVITKIVGSNDLLDVADLLIGDIESEDDHDKLVEIVGDLSNMLSGFGIDSDILDAIKNAIVAEKCFCDTSLTHTLGGWGYENVPDEKVWSFIFQFETLGGDPKHNWLDILELGNWFEVSRTGRMGVSIVISPFGDDIGIDIYFYLQTQCDEVSPNLPIFKILDFGFSFGPQNRDRSGFGFSYAWWDMAESGAGDILIEGNTPKLQYQWLLYSGDF